MTKKNKINTAIRTTYLSIFSNFLLSIIKGMAGIFGHSYALIADAIESVGDVFSSLLVLFGLKYANKPADKNHPYGHGRAEPLITFLVVAFLISSALIIAYNSITNIGHHHAVPKLYTLFILGAIISWKEILFRQIIKKSKEVNSSSLKAEAWHHRSDSITSICAFIGIFMAIFFKIEGADNWAALVSAGFILYNCYFIFRPALGEIMDEHLYDDLVQKIKNNAQKVKGILDTEKCQVRKSGMFFYIDLHAIVDGKLTVFEGHEISHDLKSYLMSQMPELADVLIHIEPIENNLQ